MLLHNFQSDSSSLFSRRSFLKGVTVGSLAMTSQMGSAKPKPTQKAQIAITFDLEMSRHYPKRGMVEWDYQKGNLDKATKQYALDAARILKKRGQIMHFFCVGRVLEQPNVDWLKEIANMGHAVGNHTYDHVNIWATKPEEIQFRFRRAPWLIQGKKTTEIIKENIRRTTLAMKERTGISANGFRSPGGSRKGLYGREDVQQLLLSEGFQWVSSLYPPHLSGTAKKEPTDEVYKSIVKAQQAGQPFAYPSGLIEIPMSPISDVGAFRSKFWKLEYFLKAVRLSVEWAIQTGGVFDFLAHPSCMVVEDPHFKTVQLICDLVKQAGAKAEIVTLENIAKRSMNKK